MPVEVRSFEPGTALFAENRGLRIYELISEVYREYLTPGGSIVLEIGQTQGEAVAGLFGGEVLKDLSGNDRVVVGRV